MYTDLTIIEVILAGFAAMIIFYLGSRYGKFFSDRRGKKDKKVSKLENKSLKKRLKIEKNKVITEKDLQHESNAFLISKLEEYREKYSGRGRIFTSSGNKKQADIVYSLLLVNEAFEQLLTEQGWSTLTDERKKVLIDQLIDTQVKQRLLTEIFNDDVIKNHVRSVLSDEKRIEKVSIRIESERKALLELE